MVQVQTLHGVTVVELGPIQDLLDQWAIDRMGQELVEIAEAAEPPTVVIDLSRVALLGSCCIEVLIRVWKRLCARDGRMVLCGVTPFCREVLLAARLDQLWEMFPTPQVAVAALADIPLSHA